MKNTWWQDLKLWWRALDGADDPTGDALLDLERRMRALEEEVRAIRTSHQPEPDRTAAQGTG